MTKFVQVKLKGNTSGTIIFSKATLAEIRVVEGLNWLGNETLPGCSFHRKK